MQPATRFWEVPPQSPHLLPQEVHVWRVRLDVSKAAAQRFSESLSDEEHGRAARFVHEIHRRSFIVSRGRLRAILAWYCNAMPREIQFRYGSQGKPALDIGWDRSGIRFNLSHSGDWAIYAVSRGQEVGVDIERVRKMDDLESLAERHFEPREQTQLRCLLPEQQLVVFFNIWTRKEALLKAVGSGLSLPLNQVAVSLSSDSLASGGKPTSTDQPIEWLSVTLEPSTTQRWSLCSLVPARGYAAALATSGERPQILRWFCNS